MTTFTPREIKNRKFKQSLMGIDAEEVKSFLKVVAAEFDKILTQNAQLEKKLTVDNPHMKALNAESLT